MQNSNYPNQQQRPQSQPGNMPMPPQGAAMENSYQYPRASKGPWVLLIVVILIVLGFLGYMFRDKLGLVKPAQNVSGYQAVFLTNGQVYFGKLSGADEDYVTLKDIYYLQVNQQLQPTGTNTATPNQPAANQQQPQLTLVKLGNELHGPTDVMKISRSQVLFYEDLKSDGKVAQAIAKSKSGQ